jgi:hypothetical protein
VQRVRRHPRLLVPLLMVVVAAVVVPIAYANLAQTAVKANPKIKEIEPSATDTYFAWTRNSLAHPNHLDAYAQPFGQAPFKVNAEGTQGFSGGIDGTTLVYEQMKNGNGDLRLFDLIAKTRSTLPAAVNTLGGNEWRPSISGDWIEFGRITPSFYRIFLYNTSTLELRKLDEVPAGSQYTEPGEVSGNFAAWTHCGTSTCHIKLYDILNQTTSTLAVAAGRYQFGAAVTADGTLYYGEGGLSSCGSSVKLKKLPLGGSVSTLLNLNPGIDFANTYAYTNVAGTDVYFAKYQCGTGGWDVYRVTAP